MPDLLQTLADRNTAHLNDLTAAFEDEVRRLDAVPASRRPGRVLAAARSIGRGVAWAADAAEGWAADMEGWLREGMNGNDFRVLSHSGTLLMRACLAIADLAERLWERAAELGAATDEVTAARAAVAAARGRMLATRPRIDEWARLAEREWPEIDPALIEKGAEQIRQGKFFTVEQAIDYVRRPRG